MRSRARCLIAAAFAFSFAPLASAQAWPAKPIRLIVNFPPGGTTDLMARALGPRLGEALGQPIMIDNRGGAAGNIGLEVVVKSVPDGYTLLISSKSKPPWRTLVVEAPTMTTAEAKMSRLTPTPAPSTVTPRRFRPNRGDGLAQSDPIFLADQEHRN